MEPKIVNLHKTDAESAHDYEMTGKVNLLVQITDEKVFDVLRAFDKYATWNFAKVALLDQGKLLVMMDFGRVPHQGKFVAPGSENSRADNLLTGDTAFIVQLGEDETSVLQSIATYSAWIAMVSLASNDSLLITLGLV